LFILYQKFKGLQPNNDGMINRLQLMELALFKFCPFKNFLPRAFKLNDMENKIGTNLMNKNFGRAGGQEAPQGEAISDLGEEEGRGRNEDNKIGLGNNNYISSEEKRSEDENDTNFAKLTLKDNKKIKVVNEENDEMKGSARNKKSKFTPPAFIDFKKFCDIMKLFNSKFPVDMKIKCKSFA